MKSKFDKNKLAIVSLKLGLAFAFFYAAASSFANPTAWFGFFPEFIRNLPPGNLILNFFSVGEIFLGIWLTTSYKTFYAAVLSAVIIFGIVVFNLGAMDIIFRDVTIFFAAVALALLTKNSK